MHFRDPRSRVRDLVTLSYLPGPRGSFGRQPRFRQQLLQVHVPQFWFCKKRPQGNPIWIPAIDNDIKQ